MKYLTFYTSICSKKNVEELNGIYIKYHSDFLVEQGYRGRFYYLTAPEYLVISACLERYFLKRLVRENGLLKGLEELPEIIAKNMPARAKNMISAQLSKYFAINDEINIEGFINFYLAKAKEIINQTIKIILRQYVTGKLSAHEFPPV